MSEAQELSDDAVIASILSGNAPAAPVAPASAEVNQPVEAAQAAPQVEPSSDVGEVEVDLTPLKLLGVPQSVLEKLPRSELLEWSSQTKERESKRSADFQQRSVEAKQALAELAALKEQAAKVSKEAERKPTVELDLDAQLKPIVDKLAEYGVPAGDELAAAIKGLKSATAAQIEGLQTVNQRLASEVGEFFVDQSRQKLLEQYPQLSDDAVFDAVRKEADMLFETGRFADIPYRKAVGKALESAAKLVLFDDIVKARSEKVQSQHRERLASQPTAPTRQQAPAPVSDEDRESMIANALIAGKLEEAQRIARS